MKATIALAGLLISLQICAPAVLAAVESPSAVEASRANRINSLVVNKTSGSMVIRIGFKDALTSLPSSFSIANPARLVFDFPDTANDLGYASKVVNEGGLRSLNIVQVEGKSRLVVNLTQPGKYQARKDGNFLTIDLNGDGSVQEAEGKTIAFAGAPDVGTQEIRNVQFRRGKDGAGIVSVNLTNTDSGIDINQRGQSIMVSFKNTKIQDQLLRVMDVIDYATPVTRVKTVRNEGNVNLEITPKGLWEHVAFQSDDQFIVEVRPLKEDPNKLFQGSRTGYQGEVISLNFQNIPLRELLHVFADITNFNIVVSDSVAGNVSLRLNDVPWDQALEIVLQQKNLSMRKNGSVLWIAPRDELAARDKLEVEARDAAQAAEVPRIETIQLNYQKAEDFAAMIAPAEGSEAASGGGGKPGSGAAFLSSIGKVTVDKRTNQVFIFDVPSKLQLVRDLLAKVDRPARQVLIEARIVEADTSFSKALGARLGGHDIQGLYAGHRLLGNGLRYGLSASAADAYTHLPETISNVPNSSADPTTNSSQRTLNSSNLPTAYNDSGTWQREAASSSIADSQFSNNAVSNPTGQFALTLFNSAKTQLLTLELTALENDGFGKTISSPRVLTADQVEATIEQGARIPYPTASSSGAVTISYVNATLALKVKPQITPDGRVMMNIKINKDEPLSEGRYGYTIKTKEIKSDVLVENGGTVVIGGVFELNESEATSRVPFLGDLPYVGFMFKRKQNTERRQELIIMITPKIVDEKLTINRT